MNWIKRIFGIKEKPIEECRLPFINQVKYDRKYLHETDYQEPYTYSRPSRTIPSYTHGINSFQNKELPRTNANADDLMTASLMSMNVTDHYNVSQSVSNDTGFDNGFGGGDFGGSGAGGSWHSGSSCDSVSSDSSSYSND